MRPSQSVWGKTMGHIKKDVKVGDKMLFGLQPIFLMLSTDSSSLFCHYELCPVEELNWLTFYPKLSDGNIIDVGQLSYHIEMWQPIKSKFFYFHGEVLSV